MTQEVNFKVGKYFGQTLQNIAIEKLYDKNFKEAISFLEDSLKGIPNKFLIELLNNNFCIFVEEETQSLFIDKRIEWCDEVGYLKFDYDNQIKSWCDKFSSSVEDYIKTIYDEVKKGEQFTKIYFTLADVFNDKDVECDSEKLNQYKGLKKDILSLVKEGMQTKDFVMWASDNKLINAKEVSESTYFTNFLESTENLTDCLIKLKKGVFENNLKEAEKELDSYIEAEKERRKPSLEPVNILDGYNAGWLFPDGTFYGLNGTVANMLHNQIAEKLYEEHIIGESELGDNHSLTLELMGCVRIHNEEVMFNGGDYNSEATTQKDLTDSQIKSIYEYGQKCCGGVLKFGIFRQPISAAKFHMMDKFAKRKLFEF